VAVNYGQIPALNRMPAKLVNQPAFRFRGSRKDHDSARISVQAMDRANARRLAAGWHTAALFASQHAREHFVEGGLTVTAARGPIKFFAVPKCGHAGRLVDDNDVRIDKVNPNVIFAGRRGLRVSQHAHDFAGG
jgi:hypothetical protein